MRDSAIRHLVAASGAPIVAAALFERTVQIWNWHTGEQLSEFDTVLDFGGKRLALNPSGDSCVAASWKKGKRDGVACYDTQSGHAIWSRPDLRHVQGLRFSPLGDAVWCWIEAGPVQRLDARTGLTLEKIRAVQDVVESPSSDHSLHLRRADFLFGGVKKVRIPRLTYALLDAA